VASFLGTGAIVETLAILEISSLHPTALSSLAASDALTSIIELLDNHNREIQAAAARVL